ncbi:P-II family nitrogen regulator [Fodinibius sediminis]|uniref:Nitrogen regulatory protein P-II family n=1 Tax=Fodinibius sediminis TaxID=1214077 RepID=A0A521BW79_9BACT|nr:P-II family nitrogen regulator [Fodinibius sediminis]SMO50690.1 nitrogen regulatory protein P-II family [Fodinibius sediminis]
MKEIKAFIRINMIDYVIDALESMDDAPGISLSEVRGWGHAEEKEAAQLVQRIKLETVVPTYRVDEIISVIVEKGQTGNYGDGKIFVSNVEKAVRIRTGETDDDVIR